ncbi:TPA: oligosaccharide repeat unit polymerase [Pseudomonas aeruginosa]|nr:oligosaccharide repeat unit polymerase [Pseudomonas aeruginosa]
MYAMLTGVTLLIFSVLARLLARSAVHPSVAMPVTWGLGLLGVSLASMIGFYPVESDALLIFLAGVLSFSLSSAIFSFIYNSYTSPYSYNILFDRDLRAKSLVFFFCVAHLFFLTVIYRDLSSIAPTLREAAYIVRAQSVSGEPLLSSLSLNYLQLGQTVMPLVVLLYLRGKCGAIGMLAVSVPWMAVILLASGRSSLMQMLVGLFFIYVLVKGRPSIKSIFVIGVAMFLVIAVGAVATSKIQFHEGDGVSTLLIELYRHVAGYALQGPVLFDRYYQGLIQVEPHWSPFNGLCSMGYILGLCEKPIQHLDFYAYAPGELGNVYSVFFSMYPHYGALGVVFFMAAYGMVCSYAYCKAKKGSLYFTILSSYFFSAIVFSLFSDQISTSWWFYVKMTIILGLLCFVFKRERMFVIRMPQAAK